MMTKQRCWMQARCGRRSHSNIADQAFNTRTNARRRSAAFAPAVMTALFISSTLNGQVTIDFEHLPDGSATPSGLDLATSFQPWGVRFSRDPISSPFAGRSLREGQSGFQNYGNSPVTAVDIGTYGDSTIILFVDPITAQPWPVSSIQVLIGDGDVGSDTFAATAYDVNGNQLYTSGCQRTYQTGYLFSHDAGEPVIASVRVTLGPLGSGPCNSIERSGAAIDDLVYLRRACPTIIVQPQPRAACPTGSAGFSVTVDFAEAHQWQIAIGPDKWTNLTTTPLTLACGASVTAQSPNSSSTAISIQPCSDDPHGIQEFLVRCAVSNSCGVATSEPATYVVCPADFNCDTTVNSTDVSDFINQWFQDQLDGTLLTDWDNNAVINSTDVSSFINTWFEDTAAGCG